MGLMAVDHLLHVLCTDTGRLLADDVHAVLHGVDSHLVVQIMGDGGDNRITVTGGDHVPVILENRIVRELLLCQLPAGWINVADGAQGTVGRNGSGGKTGERGCAGENAAVVAALCTEADDAITNSLVHGNHSSYYNV